MKDMEVQGVEDEARDGAQRKALRPRWLGGPVDGDVCVCAPWLVGGCLSCEFTPASKTLGSFANEHCQPYAVRDTWSGWWVFRADFRNTHRLAFLVFVEAGQAMFCH